MDLHHTSILAEEGYLKMIATSFSSPSESLETLEGANIREVANDAMSIHDVRFEATFVGELAIAYFTFELLRHPAFVPQVHV